MQAGTPQDDDVFAPAGAVSSSIADMVPYLRMQLNGGALAGVRVAGDEALAATHAATTVIGDDEAGPSAYALGWETFGYLGRRVVQHGGDFSNGVSTHDQHGAGRRRGHRRAHQRVPAGPCSGDRADEHAVRPLHRRCSRRRTG